MFEEGCVDKQKLDLIEHISSVHLANGFGQKRTSCRDVEETPARGLGVGASGRSWIAAQRPAFRFDCDAVVFCTWAPEVQIKASGELSKDPVNKS